MQRLISTATPYYVASLYFIHILKVNTCVNVFTFGIFSAAVAGELTANSRAGHDRTSQSQ